MSLFEANNALKQKKRKKTFGIWIETEIVFFSPGAQILWIYEYFISDQNEKTVPGKFPEFFFPKATISRKIREKCMEILKKFGKLSLSGKKNSGNCPGTKEIGCLAEKFMRYICLF